MNVVTALTNSVVVILLAVAAIGMTIGAGRIPSTWAIILGVPGLAVSTVVRARRRLRRTIGHRSR